MLLPTLQEYMDPETPIAMLYPTLSLNQIPGAPKTRITRDIRTTHPRTTGFHRLKKTGAKEKDVVSTVERKVTSPMIDMRKEKPRSAIGSGTSEAIEDREEQTGTEDFEDPTTPRRTTTSATPIPSSIPPTLQDQKEFNQEPSKPTLQSMDTKQRHSLIQELWETTSYLRNSSLPTTFLQKTSTPLST